jgi:hypothetical protein
MALGGKGLISKMLKFDIRMTGNRLTTEPNSAPERSPITLQNAGT